LHNKLLHKCEFGQAHCVGLFKRVHTKFRSRAAPAVYGGLRGGPAARGGGEGGCWWRGRSEKRNRGAGKKSVATGAVGRQRGSVSNRGALGAADMWAPVGSGRERGRRGTGTWADQKKKRSAPSPDEQEGL
jgi:hypothetical protein